MVRLYEMLCDINTKAVAEGDRDNVQDALDRVETMSAKVHEKYSFTYAPLQEIKLLL